MHEEGSSKKILPMILTKRVLMKMKWIELIHWKGSSEPDEDVSDEE